jgi:dTDP-4-amino-4,6-dideoxygalactose transaminase
MSKTPASTSGSATAAAPYLVFGKPDIRQEEIDEVLDSLQRAWLGTGPKVKAFEQAMSTYTGAQHAVAANSCTAALHLALLALEVGPGDEVIVPSMTFVATANVVAHVGARPVLVDVDPDTLCVTVEGVEAAITERTKVIIPVHFAGRLAPIRGLRELADRHGLKIVQDAAHCIEGLVDGAPATRFGDITCYSFYATKNVVTGEGGMAVTDDEKLAERMRVMGLHGLDADAWKRFSDDGYRHYECVAPGFKYNMMDLQAALGIHQLARVDEMLAIRERQWARYDEELASLPLELPAAVEAGTRHARHLYTVLLKPGAPIARDGLLQVLHRRGIGTGVHYRPLHVHPYYRDTFGYAAEDFPVALSVGDRTLSLPLGPGMSDEEQDRVIEALKEILG